MDDLKTVLYQDMYCYNHKTFYCHQRIESTADTQVKVIEDITFVELVNNRIIHVMDMDMNNYYYPIECLIYFLVTRKDESDE